MINPRTCPYCDSSNIIFVEIQGYYDGALYCECRDCQGTFHRWEEGHRLRALAQPYIHEPPSTPPHSPPPTEPSI